jgi:NAD(P) transhydrogenase subunit beta
MAHTLSTLAYLVASVLFILALRGLSHPETSRQGNLFGMVGMGIAVLATLLQPGMGAGGIAIVIAGIAIGGTIGTMVAQRIQMTALPQLVAAFHSLVGMAAVFVAAAPSTRPTASASACPATSRRPRWSRCRSASRSARSPSRARSSPS